MTMTDNAGEFIANLISNLNKNGFPEKKVALPLEKLYESAHNKGVNFNKVLAFLAAEKGIDHEKTSTKVIFFRRQTEATEAPAAGGFPGLENFGNMEELIRLGQQMFGGGNIPDDIKSGDFDFATISKKVTEMMATMSPDQIRNLQQMVASLPEDQKNELIRKARDLGIK
jgi:hypothetical protein